MASAPAPFIGTAGWSVTRAALPHFPGEGSHLERYARVLNCAEINSAFYRPHQPATYARWAASVPAGFRFAVKVPKAVTHEQRLVRSGPAVAAFLAQAGGLGDALGCLLVQLPPSLALDAGVANAFFRDLRGRHDGDVALEPRHASWFTPEADALLAAHRVGRVLADPVRFDAGRSPGGWPGLVYVRLHGSPRMYYSSYDETVLSALAHRLVQAQHAGAAVWCVFDNTASGAAIENAIALKDMP